VEPAQVYRGVRRDWNPAELVTIFRLPVNDELCVGAGNQSANSWGKVAGQQHGSKQGGGEPNHSPANLVGVSVWYVDGRRRQGIHVQYLGTVTSSTLLGVYTWQRTRLNALNARVSSNDDTGGLIQKSHTPLNAIGGTVLPP
jgi:hypothetical protein